MTRISGRVVSGLGRGAAFTGLAWAREQFLDKLGIEAHPGTLNIHLADERSQGTWQALAQSPPCSIDAPGEDNCDARAYPVFINDRVAGAVIRPLVEEYAAEQLEIIASLNLRRFLELRDGALLELSPVHPLEARAVIFDLDGTLLDTIEAFYILASRAGDEFGLSMDRSCVYELLNHGRPYWESILPPGTEERKSFIEQLNRRAVALWPEVMAEHARLHPDIRDTLQALRDRGLKLGIVTGSSRTSLDLLYSAGVEPLLDAVVTGDDVTRRKPDPEGLHQCLDLLGLAPRDAVYVGDTSIDMQACRSAGMTPVAVLSGAGNAASLCAAGAHRTVRDHRGLSDLFEHGQPAAPA